MNTLNKALYVVTTIITVCTLSGLVIIKNYPNELWASTLSFSLFLFMFSFLGLITIPKMIYVFKYYYQEKTNVFNRIKLRSERFLKENDYGLNYLIGVDYDGDKICEIDDCHSFCDDCVDEVVEEYNSILKKSPEDLDYNCTELLFEDVVTVVMTEESSPERDDFCYCENCGNLIQVSVLHTFSQEICYWLDDDISVELECLRDVDCYVLNELIENAAFEWSDLISSLKQKIKKQNKIK